jgi:hypothetical protein
MKIFPSWLTDLWNRLINNVPPQRVPWHLVVLLMDGLDEADKAHRPLKEVERFLKANSRFDLKLTFITFNDPHPYSGPFGAEHKYFLHWPEIPQKWRDQIPPCSGVLVLYKLNGRAPLQLGSSFALPQGIPVHGKLRPYSSIPVDPYPNLITGEDDYFNNHPWEGFTCRSGQICTHEIDNQIRAKVEAGPYSCLMTVAQSGIPSWEYETQRIRLGDACYQALGANED